ncbi:hypothetical protein H4S01_006831, partial [Coemansia sp. RSA 2610]
MFGRLNAKLAHLKANSQRTQTSETSAGPSSLTGPDSPASTSPSAFVSRTASNTPGPTSVATSRAASPSATSSSFQAARAAAAAKGLTLNPRQQQLQQRPTQSNPDSPALRSYHLYVETPLENAFPPLASPTAPVAPPPAAAASSPPVKRRLSSPRLAVPAGTLPEDASAHPAKHTRIDGASIAHYQSPISLPAGALSQALGYQPLTLPAEAIYQPQYPSSMLQQASPSQQQQQQ